MVALSTVLSLIKLFELPYGGSITLCSMLPILIYGYRYGVKWGAFVGFVYSMLQFVLDTSVIRGFTLASAVGVILFDFIAAFTVLGLSGSFRNRFKNQLLSFGLGAFAAMLLRYLSHVLSGAIFFGSYAQWYFSQEGMSMGSWALSNFHGAALPVFYSIVYNASYMLPELVITLAVGCALVRMTGKQLFPKN